MELIRKYSFVFLLGVFAGLAQVSIFNTLYPALYIDALLLIGLVLFTLHTDDYSFVVVYGAAGLIIYYLVQSTGGWYVVVFLLASVCAWLYQQQLLTESLFSYAALGAGVSIVFGLLLSLLVMKLSLTSYVLFIIIGMLSLSFTYALNNRLKRFIGRRFYSRNTYSL